jgi:hypothetical protein
MPEHNGMMTHAGEGANNMPEHNGMMTYAGEGANLTRDTSQRKWPAVGYIHFAPKKHASADPTG